MAGLVVQLQMEFAGRGNGWTTLATRDLMDDPIRLRYGIQGSGPNDRVATAGALSFTLNNSASNSAGLIGYYSPNHANKRPGFQLGIGVRLVLSPEGRPKTVVSSSVANPSVITTSAAHNYSTGDRVEIVGHSGSTPDINGVHTISVLSATTFSLDGIEVTVGGTGGTVTRKNLFYKFSGTLDRIAPAPGLYSGDFGVRCTALDWMNDAARQKVTNIATQTNISSDAAFNLLVNSVPNPPIAVEIQQGQETYQYAFDNTRDEANAVLSELQRLAMSELGFIYIKGDRTHGGTLVFESRRTRALSTTNLDEFVDATSDGTGLVSVAMEHSRDTVINKVQLVTHPRRVDPVTTTVLARLENPTPVGANSSITLLFPYRDPAQEAARVGGIDMQTPVAYTDYAMNAASDGSGADLTANFTVIASFGGNGVRYTVTNNGSVSGYVTLLQARGRGIYDYQNVILEAEDSDSIVNHGEHAVTVDMPYQSDPAVGAEASLYLVNLYKDPTSRVSAASVFAPYSDADYIDRLLKREISDRIGITEQVTGLAPGARSLGHFINAVDLAVDGRNNLAVSFLLAPADRTSYWQLEFPGRTELDQTTVLGFGQIIGHTDIAHCDTHYDVAHDDVAHSDTTHGDSAHVDTEHSDVAHVDSPHGDVPHVDSPHDDDPHEDSHSDVSHADTPHSDIPHIDLHDDFTHADAEGQPKIEHFDQHDDIPHSDSHTDVAHSDSHQDEDHDDDPHGDTSFQDVAFDDIEHQDAGHGDAEHNDVAFVDVPHEDVAFVDDHCDVQHGDI